MQQRMQMWHWLIHAQNSRARHGLLQARTHLLALDTRAVLFSRAVCLVKLQNTTEEEQHAHVVVHLQEAVANMMQAGGLHIVCCARQAVLNGCIIPAESRLLKQACTS